MTSAQLYTFRNYNHRDGLSMESTLSSAQDGKGYLWVGTDGAGLMRFDGLHFHEVGPAGKSFQYHVSSIYTKPDGTLFFSSLYDGVFSFVKDDYNLIYKPSRYDGESRYVSMVDTSLVLVCNNSINILSQKGRLIRRYSLRPNGSLTIQQVLKIPQAVLVFTNCGNFIIRENKIIPLESWFSKFANTSFKPVFGTFSTNRLVLYSGDVKEQLELVITNDCKIFSGRRAMTPFKVTFEEGDRVVKVCERQNKAYLYTEKSRIYQLKNESLKYIILNYSGAISSIEALTIDQNDDLWMNCMQGLFKVSLEPFTKVELNQIYADNTICLVHRTTSNVLILGNMNGILKVGNIYSNNALQSYNYRGYQVSESNQGVFIATDQGVLQVKNFGVVPTSFPHQKGKEISLIHWDGSSFWYSPRGEGLVRYNPTSKQTQLYVKLTTNYPDHFYTAQNNFDNTTVYFGTNDGIYKFEKKSEKMRRIDQFSSLGSYSGVSTKDKFGTCWFSMDKGLAGITSRGDFIQIDDPSKLPSTLFYTLTSDDYGNLIAGTNKGINIITVDKYGNVVHQTNYSSKEGFGGYETHMRSQFQFGNYGYVGTIEGLFLINTEVFRAYPLPPKPIILLGKENANGVLQKYSDNSSFTFRCLLAKSNAILYSYRVKGFKDKWSDFSFENQIELANLPNGTYELEVRASYDGISISSTATHTIVIELPIWRTKWFIVFLVIVLGIINIAYLEWSKSYLSNNIFDTKDVSIDVRMIPKLILFGLVINASMLIVAQSVDATFGEMNVVNLVFSGIMLGFYLLSRYYTTVMGSQKILTALFYLTYGALMVENYYLIYTTNIHPFPVFSITMATSVIPFVVTRIRWVIIITFLQLFIAATLLIWVEDVIYNEILFIAAIMVSGGIAIMVTYLRNNSLEKLIFVSGVINKGNVMAISFNQKGIITYCSENITDFFALDFTAVVGKQVSILNPFVAASEMREISLTNEFEDGRIFLIPMYDKNNNVIWIEWSCKYFNDAVKVIMGQDVTDKLTLTTNYQSLVENAQDMIYQTDIDGNFIFANERCVQLFGFRHDTIIGKNSILLIAPDHKDRVVQFYTDQFQNRLHHTYVEFPIKSRDGRIFWVGQNVTMVYEPGSRKRVSGFIALARDITEKRANDLLIEQQNKDITASINSAKRIQFNLLPDPRMLNVHFEQSFVLFKPKDIVSGDFYWVEEMDNKLIVVLADCTGHGVPGAFITILGINLLNQIVRERKQFEPDVILNQLNRELELILRQNEGSVMFDSMETLVCVFEKDVLTYASSGVSMVHQKEDELILHRSTKIQNDTDVEHALYTKHEIYFDSTDRFYLLTDGYQKQFGSIRNKKFGFKRILELLEKICIESMPLQKKYFENAWRNWSETQEQTDDITIIGLKGFNPKEESRRD